MGEGLLALMYIAAGLVSTILTNKSNQQSMQQQANWNEQMTDKQNDYNLPSKQIQRLKDAGINPTSLGMGQGMTIAGNTSANVSPYNLLPMSDPFSMASNSLLSNMSAFKARQEGKTENSMRELRVEQMQAQNEAIRAQAQNWNLNNEAQMILNKYLDYREAYALAGQKADIDLKYSQVAHFRQQVSNMRYELEKILPADLKIRNMQLEEIVARVADYEASANLKKQQSELTAEQVETEQAKQENLSADTAEKQKNVSVMDKLIEKYDAEIGKIGVENDWTKEQTYWYLFKLYGEQNMRLGPIQFNANHTSPKGAVGVQREYNSRYSN